MNHLEHDDTVLFLVNVLWRNSGLHFCGISFTNGFIITKHKHKCLRIQKNGYLESTTINLKYHSRFSDNILSYFFFIIIILKKSIIIFNEKGVYIILFKLTNILSALTINYGYIYFRVRDLNLRLREFRNNHSNKKLYEKVQHHKVYLVCLIYQVVSIN